MDIDSQISNLEGGSFMSLGSSSKTLFVKIGISLLLALVFIYSIRPLFMLELYQDTNDKKCKTRIKIKPFLTSSIIFTFMLYYILQKSHFFFLL